MTGRPIVEALINGQDDVDHLLTLFDRRVKAPPEKLRSAFQSRNNDRHRFLLRMHLRQIDALTVAAPRSIKRWTMTSPLFATRCARCAPSTV